MFGEINVFYLLLVIYLLIFVISYILAAKKQNRSKMTEVAFVSIFVCVLFFTFGKMEDTKQGYCRELKNYWNNDYTILYDGQQIHSKKTLDNILKDFDANHMYIDKSKDNKTINILKK